MTMVLTCVGTINTYINTATLRLYEPPILETSLLISMSESLTSPTLGAASALDIFYQSRNALKSFFDNWLALPVAGYYCQTTATAAQLVYALTMLGRWAKFTAPFPTAKPQTPMPADLSANPPNESLLRADIEYCENVSLGSRRPTPSESSPDSARDSSLMSQIVLREGSDPRLPAAVAALRSQLKNQPDLALDVAGILSRVGSRFEEANATFQVASAEPGVWDHNVWSMSAIKVRITKAKLERWAEIVAAGTEALKLHDDDDQDEGMEDSAGGETGESSTTGSEVFAHGNAPVDPMQMPNWNGVTPWTSDLLQGVDPSYWFDGYLDWGAVVMNSMGNLEQ